jgi:heterodisulfide reductase subunit B
MPDPTYSYYPGCSLGATGKAYDVSTRAVCRHLGIRLEELPDWNCCGATAYFSVDDAASFAVAARNLAIAEQIGHDLITPCSACYITLAKTNYYFREYPEVRKRIKSALSAAGLEYNGTIEARHLLYMFVEDFGMERLRAATGGKGVSLDVAPYYGCQIVRPFTEKESPDIPESMDRLIEACGSRAVDYPLKTKCCGGALTGIDEKGALGLIHSLIECAARNDADCIITPCPLCQTNLDAYQFKVNKAFGTDYHMPVLFFTQLIGLALGMSEDELGLEMGIEAFKPAAAEKRASI